MWDLTQRLLSWTLTLDKKRVNSLRTLKHHKQHPKILEFDPKYTKPEIFQIFLLYFHIIDKGSYEPTWLKLVQKYKNH